MPVLGHHRRVSAGTETRYTFCRLCEAICGLKVSLDGGRVSAIASDELNPLSRGFICVKGAHADQVLYNPNRVLHPMRRDGTQWERAGWDAAMTDIGERLRRIVEDHGPDSVGTYLGNPSAMSAVTFYLAGAFMRALGSSRRYSSMTLDNMNKFFVAEEMFGDKSLILQRDWKNADYMLVLGHNPRISIFGQLSSRPRGLADVRAAQENGSRLVIVDPRLTETAQLAAEHLRIAPGTDAYFLMALLNVIIGEGLYDRDFVERYCENFEDLKGTISAFTPESVAAATTIDAATSRRVARDFAASKSAFALGNTGLTQQRHATVNEWAIEVLNAITGNIDRAGGAYYNPGVVDEPRPKRSIDWDQPSRIGGYPRLLEEYPAATLADEILTPGEGQVRAMIVVAGNPLATGADVARLREAFASLELLVVVDVRRSETAEHAHWLLPATTFFERKDINVAFTRHTPFPFVQYTDAVVAPQGSAREEWEIFRDLHRAVGTPFLGREGLGEEYGPEDFFADFLQARGIVGLEEVKAHPHGLKLGETPIGAFRALLDRHSRRINLAPTSIIDAVPAAAAITSPATADYPILLISRRNLRSVCSWHHQADGKAPDNGLEISTTDAQAIGIKDGGWVRVNSRTGTLTAIARITDALTTGVVSLQFGFPGAGGQPMNVLVDAVEGCDPLTGIPTLNGIPVHVEGVD